MPIPDMTPEQRRRVAIHEAGHAVCDSVMDMPVESVSIRPGPAGSLGVTCRVPVRRTAATLDEARPVACQAPELRSVVEKRIIASLAGPEAEMLLVGAAPLQNQEDGDETNAADLARAFAGPGTGDFYLEWLRAEAHQLVTRHTPAILTVADALEQHEYLLGDQVAALVYSPKGAARE